MESINIFQLILMEFADYDENRLLMMEKIEQDDENDLINRYALTFAPRIILFMIHMNVLLS